MLVKVKTSFLFGINTKNSNFAADIIYETIRKLQKLLARATFLAPLLQMVSGSVQKPRVLFKPSMKPSFLFFLSLINNEVLFLIVAFLKLISVVLFVVAFVFCTMQERKRKIKVSVYQVSMAMRDSLHCSSCRLSW